MYSTIQSRSATEFVLPLEVIRSQRITACRNYLDKSGISLDDVKQVCGTELDLSEILLTSSLVQGLANRTSDIDIVIITKEEVAGAGVATQIYQKNKHFETIRFRFEDLRASLDALHEIAQLDPPELLKAFQSWDKTQAISKKYIERIVNGVNCCWDLPYLEHLPSLARIWHVNSFNVFRACLALSIISSQSQEYRAVLGYALNGMLYLMDAAMSFEGYVFNNKKWFWQRWKLFKELTGNVNLYDRITAVWNQVFNAMNTGEINFLKDIHDLYEAVVSEFELIVGESDTRPVNIPNEVFASKPFLENSRLVVNNNSYATLVVTEGISASLFESISFGSLHTLRLPEARFLLNLTRAGILKISL